MTLNLHEWREVWNESVKTPRDSELIKTMAKTERQPAGRAIATGVVHKLPADLRKVLASDPAARAAWEDITPLARNEFICWVLSAKKPETRSRRIDRTRAELTEGMRRPCCWPGCPHR